MIKTGSVEGPIRTYSRSEKWLGRFLLAIGIVWVFFLAYLNLTAPSAPNPDTGEIHELKIWGPFVYVTTWEYYSCLSVPTLGGLMALFGGCKALLKQLRAPRF